MLTLGTHYATGHAGCSMYVDDFSRVNRRVAIRSATSTILARLVIQYGLRSELRIAFLVCFALGIALAQDPGYKYFPVGQPLDAVSKTRPGFALMGGGTDQDAAFRWMCDRAGSGDFVVLRASGNDAYNPYIKQLCPALSSVQTLIVTSRLGAGQPFVVEKVRTASAVFIAGGSQDNYINFWQRTPLGDAINSAIKKGVPVGGTSAGLAVLGEYSFAALKDTVKSDEALRDPFNERMTITGDFLRVPGLVGKITDSHFVARDRMGRLIAFLARIASHGWTNAPFGIGIDEKTVVLMDADGGVSAIGAGAAYFLHAPGPPEQCQPNTVLTYRNISVYKLTAGAARFNINSWTGSGGVEYTLSAENGVLKSSLAGDRVY
jgi:cyanophycinase